MSDSYPPQTRETTSALVKRILAELPEAEVPIGVMLRQFRRRSFGGLLLILGVIGLVPGVSIVTGLLILIPGIQMVLGFRAPLLPRFVRRKRLARSTLRQVELRLVPWLERIERHVKPRWFVLTQPPFPNFIGLLVVALALVIMLPLPFSNAPPALALACLSLGLLERDGVLTCIGIVCALLATAIGILVASIALKSVMLVL